jgi:hypothetical protein
VYLGERGGDQIVVGFRAGFLAGSVITIRLRPD